MRKISMSLAVILIMMLLLTGCGTTEKKPPALRFDSATGSDVLPDSDTPLEAQPPKLSLPTEPEMQPSAAPAPIPTDTQDGVQGAEGSYGYGYGKTEAFPAGTSWITEDGDEAAEQYLLKNGEAYLYWVLSDGTVCPLSDCFWTLHNDDLLLFNNGGVEVRGSMTIENVELNYNGDTILLMRGEDAGNSPRPEHMVGSWNLVSVNADGYKFNPNNEGIFSWLNVHEDLSLDYHLHDSQGHTYDEENLGMEMLDGALIHEYGNHFWHGRLVGNTDPDTVYYITLTDTVLLLVEYTYTASRDTPAITICEYMPYSP